MAATVGLRPSPLLVFTVVLLFGSVIADDGPPVMHMLCDPTISNVLKLSPDSLPFLIRSPFFPYDKYSSGDDCSMVLESGNDPLVLTFKFRRFSVEWSKTCSFDYLCLHGVKFCSYWKGGSEISYILPENMRTTVLFRSDWGDQEDGFDIPQVYELCHPHQTYNMNTSTRELLFPAYHSVRLHANSRPFVIHNPYWPKISYEYNKKCSLVLQSGPEPLILSFNYRQVLMASSHNCEHSYLCVNGVKFCDSWTRSYVYDNVLPANSNFTIYFQANRNTKAAFEIIVTPRRAVDKEVITEVTAYIAIHNILLDKPFMFNAEMSYVDRCPALYRYQVYTLCYTPGSNVVKLSPDSTPAIILSPKYGIGNYSSSCSLVLESGLQPLHLTFLFKKFQLQHEHYCTSESLCVHGATYCGNRVNGRLMSHILPENSRSTIFFKTKFAQGMSDFEIHLTTRLAHTSETAIEPRGVLDDNLSLSFVKVTYTPGMPYQDLCTIKHRYQVYALCYTPGSNVVKLSPDSTPATILSPKYGIGSYSSNCSLVLESGPQPLYLTFHFKKFQLQHEHYCTSESLCVHGATYCGNWVTGRLMSHILPENSRSTIFFKTKFAQGMSDFEIHLTTRLAHTSETAIEPRGVLDDNFRLSFVTVTYTPGMPYQDLCTISHVKRVYELCQTHHRTVNISASSRPFIVQSPNWKKGHYGNNLGCSLDLISGSEPLVLTLNYRNFSVVRSIACREDFLCANRVKLCGRWGTSRVSTHILPENRTFTFMFHTDDRFTVSGFEILVRTRRALNNELVSEVTKYHPYREEFEFENVTYHPGIFYHNECSVSRHTSTTTGRLTTHTELLTKPAEILATSAELLTKPAEILTTSAELLTKPAELLTKSAELLTKPAEILIKSADLLTKATDILTIALNNPLHTLSFSLHPQSYSLNQLNYSLHLLSYTLHKLSYSLRPLSYSLHQLSYSLHPLSYSLHQLSYSLHPLSYSLHQRSYSLQPLRYSLHQLSYLLHQLSYSLQPLRYPLQPLKYPLHRLRYPLHPLSFSLHTLIYSLQSLSDSLLH